MKPNAKNTWDGPRRVRRIELQEAAQKRVGLRLAYLKARRTGMIPDPKTRSINVTGLKKWYVSGLEGFVKTPYGRKLKARRRAAGRVAHESRRRNYGGT